MSPTRFRRLWLLTCLTLLGGLATLVPVNCLCDANQHWGQAVHPIFLHHHADGHDHLSAMSSENVVTPGEVSWTVSDHGAMLNAVFDGSMSGRWSAWLALMLLAMLTLRPTQRGAPLGLSTAPPTGPPRPSPLFR